MFNLWDKFWKYIFDIDGCRTTWVMDESVTGEPLMVWKKYVGLSKTKNGNIGAFICVRITQFGDCPELIKEVLQGEHNNYLSVEDLQSIKDNVYGRLAKGGEYITTSKNSTGNLNFIRKSWNSSDIKEISDLLEKNNENH